MDRNFNRAVTATLKYEGGYVNQPSDPGGATNLGVTIATFRRYVKPSGTIADLKALTVEQAKTRFAKIWFGWRHPSNDGKTRMIKIMFNPFRTR